MNKISVTYFQRKPYAGHWSIEAIFVTLRALLAAKITARIKIAVFISRGFLKRVAIGVEAAFCQSDVNHITGDIHYIAAFLQPAKTVLTIHDCRILSQEPSIIKRKIFLYFWYRMPTRRVGYITVVSAFTKRELLHYVPDLSPEKITIVAPFISESFFSVPKVFNKACPALLHVGTAINKNLLRLIEAIEGIACTLTIVGKLTTEHSQKLLQHNIQYRNVSEISEAQMVDELVRADVLTFVSTFEGFGMPIIEANRMGRPVITSNVTSMPDVAGDAACLVNPFDVESIRNGLLQIINDEDYRNNLIAKGLQNAERFNNQATAQQYYDIYCRIVHGKKGQANEGDGVIQNRSATYP